MCNSQERLALSLNWASEPELGFVDVRLVWNFVDGVSDPVTALCRIITIYCVLPLGVLLRIRKYIVSSESGRPRDCNSG
jgi:hypothetical protein